MVFDYANHRFLADPYFAPRFSLPSYSGRSQNPIVDLPMTIESIVQGTEMVILSHCHGDHFDAVGQALLAPSFPILCQPSDEQTVREKGFTNVTPIADSLDWNGIHITRVGGHHGIGLVEDMMGIVSGYIFQAAGEPTVYWAGDSVLCDDVRAAIARFNPDIIITHSNGAMWTDSAEQRVYIVMDAEQTIATAQLAPASRVMAIHMEAVDHGTVTRAELRERALQAGISYDRLLIPQDGEQVTIA
jgi:L-ascorbate metabolism protein UlaG (beta-lactamase superfamily)